MISNLLKCIIAQIHFIVKILSNYLKMQKLALFTLSGTHLLYLNSSAAWNRMEEWGHVQCIVYVRHPESHSVITWYWTQELDFLNKLQLLSDNPSLCFQQHLIAKLGVKGRSLLQFTEFHFRQRSPKITLEGKIGRCCIFNFFFFLCWENWSTCSELKGCPPPLRHVGVASPRGGQWREGARTLAPQDQRLVISLHMRRLPLQHKLFPADPGLSAREPSAARLHVCSTFCRRFAESAACLTKRGRGGQLEACVFLFPSKGFADCTDLLLTCWEQSGVGTGKWHNDSWVASVSQNEKVCFQRACSMNPSNTQTLTGVCLACSFKNRPLSSRYYTYINNNYKVSTHGKYQSIVQVPNSVFLRCVSIATHLMDWMVWVSFLCYCHLWSQRALPWNYIRLMFHVLLAVWAVEEQLEQEHQSSPKTGADWSTASSQSSCSDLVPTGTSTQHPKALGDYCPAKIISVYLIVCLFYWWLVSLCLVLLCV